MSPARPRRALPSVLGLTLALILAACSTSGGTTSSPPDPTGSIAPAITGTPSAAPSMGSSPAAAFPLTLTDDEGTAVELEAEPTTIVSLTPATTEILFAIGAGDRVVATDDASDFPAEAVELPDVATFSSVDVERIVDLGADLVVAGGLGFSPPGSIAQLRELGIPVVVVYAPSVEGVYRRHRAPGDGHRRDDRRHRARRVDADRDRRHRGRDPPGRHGPEGVLRDRLHRCDGPDLRTRRCVVRRRDGDARRRRRHHHR